MATANKQLARRRRHQRVRKRVFGTAQRPRLSVFRSLKHFYANLIDDETGRTLVSAATLEPSLREDLSKPGTVSAARQLGGVLAERALAAGIKQAVFDRGGYLFHGRVKALAEGARAGGLKL